MSEKHKATLILNPEKHVGERRHIETSSRGRFPVPDFLFFGVQGVQDCCIQMSFDLTHPRFILDVAYVEQWQSVYQTKNKKK